VKKERTRGSKDSQERVWYFPSNVKIEPNRLDQFVQILLQFRQQSRGIVEIGVGMHQLFALLTWLNLEYINRFDAILKEEFERYQEQLAHLEEVDTLWEPVPTRFEDSLSSYSIGLNTSP
jgi:hypothetical protein